MERLCTLHTEPRRRGRI